MLSLRVKTGYGTGDMAINLLFQMTVLYLLFFYTDVAGIAPGVVAVIFLISRTWDAVNDPMMGVVIDHTRSRHGKSRVYLRYVSLPLAVATVLLFYVPDWEAGGRTLYAGITYIVWGMLFTMVNIPYASMTAEITDDPVGRTELSSVRMIFMLLGVVVVSVATEPLVRLFGGGASGFFRVAVVYAVPAFLLFQLCFSSTGRAALAGTTSTSRPAGNGYKLTDALPIVMRNRQLLILTITFLIGATAEYLRQASVIYFVTYNMGDGTLLPVFMAVVVVSMIGANLLIPAATRRWDKRGTYMAGCTIAIVASVVFHFIPHGNLALVLILAAISSFGFTVVSTMGWSMLPDTVEYGQAVTGVRTEGVIYSVFSFSQKLATALAGALAAVILQAVGYVARSPTQTEAALTGILSTLTFIPAALLGLSMVILRFYTLDRDTFARMKAGLQTSTGDDPT